MGQAVKYPKIAEGKTKIIYEIPGTDEVFIENKSDITAGDGARRNILEGKDILSTETTCNCFELLNRAGVLTHFIKRVDERTFRAKKLDMIPVELVARRIACGSYLKRNPHIKEGTFFNIPVIEFFYKDDSLHDPLMTYDIVGSRWLFYDAKKPLKEGFLSEKSGEEFISEIGTEFFWLTDLPSFVNILRSTTYSVFFILENAWQKQEVTLVDLKIECGFNPLTKKVFVGDVIDNDSWRIWPHGDKSKMKDKQVYREIKTATPEDLKAVQDNYRWVAEATKKFADPQ